MTMINDVQVGDDQNELFSDEERNKLTTYLTESITNLSLQLKNKSNRCRYSEHAINISMSLYLRIKSIYTLTRENNTTALPHPNTLKRKLLKLKPKEGIDPKSLYYLKELMKTRKDNIKGHLMMDEIKLKNGIMWNSMNGVVTGFIKDEMNMKDMMMDILGISTKNKTENRQVTAYANQWRFRSTRGDVHNCFYYFNKGSLIANYIASQFVDVLIFL